MIDWLQYAEEHHEKVHVIGHHPPRMCMVSFSWAYARIVSRYQNTIAAQFFAHTHYDEFTLFYDEIDSTRPVGISYITPSFTTYPNLNPAYRFYTIDVSSLHSLGWHDIFIVRRLNTTPLFSIIVPSFST
jgi:sphingomyelin phosphodiesterase